MNMDRQWNANWITCPVTKDEESPMFKKTFRINKEINNSKIYISGLGFYYFKVNGKRVGEDIMQPAFSHYDKTVYYNEYDLNDYLVTGLNTIEVTLGNGWYNEVQANDWNFELATWRSKPKMIAEIFVNDTLLVKTDRSWLCGKSCISFNSLRCGESYDSTYEPKLSNNAVVTIGPGGMLKKQNIQPIRVTEELLPQKTTFLEKNIVVYDFGTNISGNVEITINGGQKGRVVAIQYSEKIRESMSADIEDIGKSVKSNRHQRDIYTMSGKEGEKWHSEFTYHGFRYVHVYVWGSFEDIQVKARCFHTDVEKAGSLECDNEVINKIQSALLRSTLTNLHHIPTDCPHREKNGWTADAYLSAEQALFNFNMKDVYVKYLDDIVDCQKASGQIPCIVPTSQWGYDWGSGPTWDAVLFIIPWQLYMYSGDKKYLERYFGAMGKYITYMKSLMENGICKIGLGEWCALGIKGDPIPNEVVITAFCYYNLKLYKDICGVLTKKEEAKETEKLLKFVKKAFIKNYGNLKLENLLYHSLLIYFDLCTDKNATLLELKNVIERMDYHIYGGVFCSKILLNVLNDNNMNDIAYRIVTQKDFPGWYFMQERCGGTLGEGLRGGSSYNHHFWSTVGEWFYKALAGFNIERNTPGFEHITIKPYIADDIKSFKAWHQTKFGNLEISYDTENIFINIPNGAVAQFIYKDIDKKLNSGKYTFKR